MAAEDTPVVFTVQSRGSIRIPAAYLLVDGVLSIDASVQRRGYFTVHFQNSELELTAGGFCGYIPLNARLAVDIRPKMPVSSLDRIFDVASLTLQKVGETARRYDIGPESSGPVLEFLAGELVGALRSLVGRGLRKRYERRGQKDSRPRGAFDFTRTLRDNLARGKGHLLNTSSFRHLLDIPENRVLRAAGELIIRKLRVQRKVNAALIADLGQLLSFFAGVGRMAARDFRITNTAEQGPTSEAERDYDIALTIALLILKEHLVETSEIGHEVDLAAVVVDFDALFEEYLRNLLRLERQKQDLPFFVLDGNKDGKKNLFDGRPNPKAHPDVVIRSRDGIVRLLVEVKYKSAPDRSDFNQAITYAASYRVGTIVIAHQAVRREDAGLVEVGRVGHIRLCRYGFLLDTPELRQQEIAFADVIFSLVNEDR